MKWVKKLIEYYSLHARTFPWRSTKDPYAIWISEIMLQQTRTETVVSYYLRFLERFPTIQRLASASDEELFKAWEGLGYYSRARNLKKAAQIIVNSYNGVFPNDYDRILSLPGIGPYTAGAVSSIAFALPYPAVDGNALRVYSRLYADSFDVSNAASRNKVDSVLKELIPADQPGFFNQALMDVGATICLPNGEPRCDICPLSAECKAHAAGTELNFPVKHRKKERIKVSKTVFVLETAHGVLGYIRSTPGVLSGLYQLPDTDAILSVDNALTFIHNKGLSPVGELQQYSRKHVFTHMEWNMRVFKCTVLTGCLPDGWIELLSDKHALPTAYKKCLTSK